MQGVQREKIIDEGTLTKGDCDFVIMRLGSRQKIHWMCLLPPNYKAVNIMYCIISYFFF